MKKLKFLVVNGNIFILLLLGLLFNSCNDPFSSDLEIQKTRRIEGVNLENGMLVFDSEIIYESVLSNISSLESEEANSWEDTNFPGFISQRMKFDNIEESDIANALERKSYRSPVFSIIDNEGELQVYRNIDSDALATAANENGVLKIGEHIYYVGYEHIIKVPFVSKSTTEQWINSNWSVLPENAKFYNVDRTITRIADSRVNATVHDCHDEYRNKWRGLAELWVTNTGSIYSGTGARAKHQKKTFGIWWAKNAGTIRLTVDGDYSQYLNEANTFYETVNYDSGIRYNINKIQWVWYECFSIYCFFTADATITVDGSNDGYNFDCTSS